MRTRTLQISHYKIYIYIYNCIIAALVRCANACIQIVTNPHISRTASHSNIFPSAIYFAKAFLFYFIFILRKKKCSHSLNNRTLSTHIIVLMCVHICRYLVRANIIKLNAHAVNEQFEIPVSLYAHIFAYNMRKSKFVLYFYLLIIIFFYFFCFYIFFLQNT